ncbi:Uncharacterized membrane protein [Granulicatella balaenopterae]|uniref:Uncharacterized membrane protein n=1 Tax=Granulicatella balaenopterae TaxID=137733 RepID=A0A1H9HCH1_9LACT|nr:DMT family transporter [Granulicatella balaenopterae]SEQ59992.1 Uncharacterized membrane protein [Granulicatella balaenopterae]
METNVGAKGNNRALADKKMAALNKKFHRQGVVNGLLSGFTFALYSTIVAIAASYEPLISAAGIFAAPFVCSGLNDFFSGLWLLIYNIKLGKTKELMRTLKTKSGQMLVLGFLIGGPLANGAYLMGIAMAGAYAIPISATCSLFGTLFAWIFFKDRPSKRVILGMILCVAGAGIIGYAKVDNAPNFTLGIICALIASMGWGLEGMFSSFGGSMLDSDVTVNLRQLISGLVILILVIPFLGEVKLLVDTIVAVTPALWLVVSGLGAVFGYLLWYKANCQAGVAVGMSLNVTYAFWGVLLGVLFLDQPLTVNIVVGSIVIVLGAIIVTTNPLDFFKKGDEA